MPISDATLKKHNHYVAKKNALIQKAQFSLSEQQKKILMYMISEIDKDDKEDTVYKFSIREFCRTFNLDENNGYYYQTIKRDIDIIDNQKMYMLGKDEEGNIIKTRLRWLNILRHNETKQEIVYNFHEDIRPYLFDLKDGGFYKHKLKYGGALVGKYTYDLYQLLFSYRRLGQADIPLERLRFVLDAEKYERFPDLRRFVIKPAVEEINKKTDIYVDWNPEKQPGQRAISYVHFKVYPIGGNEDLMIEREENTMEALGYFE